VADYENNKEHIAEVVMAHTRHSYKPDSEVVGMSNCIDCHMRNGGSGHTFECVPPEKTLTYQAEGGQPSSCAVGCHVGWPLDFGLSSRTECLADTWNKPYDVDLAERLREYYGPGGLWWDQEESGSYRESVRPSPVGRMMPAHGAEDYEY